MYPVFYRANPDQQMFKQLLVSTKAKLGRRKQPEKIVWEIDR